ncbi:Septin-4 [Anabarilius grahami]|uniref:Septin-4 n=1 Tax=Anabarilius grahami TaxID=495550 RepID=A0A3N0YWY7_ANAGA|nr:Septin-4 [Anabarilius grahami]
MLQICLEEDVCLNRPNARRGGEFEWPKTLQGSQLENCRVENPSHSDFVHLRNMLIRTHMQDLKHTTHYVLYENYRINCLCKNPCLLSSLAIEDCEDAELAYTMRDLPPRAGHTFPGHETPMMNREPDGSTHPHTPGTPTFTRPVSRSLRGSEPELPHRGQLSSMSSLDSPLSPSRPKSPWGRFDPYDSAEDQDKEYVGFATLPNQVHRKSVKKGFAFTLMVAGESGLGKSTLVNSLFLTDLYKDRKMLNAEGVCYGQRTQVHFIDGILNAQRYRDEILRPIVVPFIHDHHLMLQHDNARPHVARICTQFLEAENIPLLAWPAYSPDMSPIEHVRDALDRRIRQRVPVPVSSNFAQPLKRSGPTFHRP